MNAEKPRVLFPKDEPTLWVDVRSGRAIDHNGRIGPIPAGPRRKNPNLTDCLDAAGRGLYQRIVFVGPVPPPREGIRHWLYVETPGWKPLHLWRNPSAGRFTPANPENDEDTNPKRFAVESGPVANGSAASTSPRLKHATHGIPSGPPSPSSARAAVNSASCDHQRPPARTFGPRACRVTLSSRQHPKTFAKSCTTHPASITSTNLCKAANATAAIAAR